MINQDVIDDLAWLISLFQSSPLVILAGVFTIYFALQKATVKVGASFGVTSTRFYDAHINDVILTNQRDNAVAVSSIILKINFNKVLVLEDLDSPLVIKAYDTVKVEIPKYSYLWDTSGEVKIDFFDNMKIGLVTVTGKIIYCDTVSSSAFGMHDGIITKNTKTYDGIVLTPSYGFIFTYYIAGVKSNLIIDKYGYMDGDNPFNFNYLKPGEINKETFSDLLISYNLHLNYDNYILVEINEKLETVPVLTKIDILRKLGI